MGLSGIGVLGGGRVGGVVGWKGEVGGPLQHGGRD